MKTLITRSLPRLRTALLISLLLTGTTAFAEEANATATADTLAEMATGIDTVWMLLAAMLVFFMQPGFALVEAGFTRTKNTGNIHVRLPTLLVHRLWSDVWSRRFRGCASLLRYLVP